MRRRSGRRRGRNEKKIIVTIVMRCLCGDIADRLPDDGFNRGASAAAEPESTAEGESAGTENGVEEASAGDG